MPDLRELEQRIGRGQVPEWLQRIATPLRYEERDKAFESHPDKEFRAYILNGIRHGFHIGFDRSCHREYLSKEILLGRIIGPVNQEEGVPAGTQVSPFGVIPKSGQPGKWRLIVDLSSPEGGSVNDGIDQDLCSLKYLQLDDVMECISRSGRGTLLAKMDIESAYRMGPIHPEDKPLLAVRWAGEMFFDTRVPFGLRSAPKIFTAVADALQWAFRKERVSWVAQRLPYHGPANSAVCADNMEGMLSACRRLGVPVVPEKCTGPAEAIVFLVFELDTRSMVVRLPQAKTPADLEVGPRMVRKGRAGSVNWNRSWDTCSTQRQFSARATHLYGGQSSWWRPSGTSSTGSG